jgi:hypothetical protein
MRVDPQAQFSGQSMETITKDTDRDFFMSAQVGRAGGARVGRPVLCSLRV